MFFDFAENYPLENDRVRMRPLELGDKEWMAEYSINEPEIWHFNAYGADGEEKLEEYIANAVLQREQAKEYPFVVFDKRVGRYVGSTRFYAIFPHLESIEIGYTWYATSSQGTGLNKNCKQLLLTFAFETLNVERVAFAANSKNTRSIAAMKSIGCIEEGVMRSSGLDANGDRMDVMRLSILKNEWYDTVKKLLESQVARGHS
jgi:N-acetyltransferase